MFPLRLNMFFIQTLNFVLNINVLAFPKNSWNNVQLFILH